MTVALTVSFKPMSFIVDSQTSFQAKHLL